MDLLPFAPDPETANRAASLANARSWVVLGVGNNAVWGECKGSGATPYRVGVDLNIPAFRCDCPAARGKNCKHALGLYLLFHLVPDAFNPLECPAWLSPWLEKKRGTKEEVAEAPKIEAEAPVKSEAKLKRRAERLEQMSKGVAELERWLGDLARQGLAAADAQGSEFWDRASKRMADAKLQGPSYLIKEMMLDGAEDRLFNIWEKATSLYLLSRTFRNLDSMPPEMQDDLLLNLGVTIQKKEVLENEGIQDEWSVLGVAEGIDLNDLHWRRTWMRGTRSGKMAMILDFAFGGDRFENNWRSCTYFQGELVFYPSAYPTRALLKNLFGSVQTGAPATAFIGVDDMLQQYAEALSVVPWLSRFPASLHEVTPVLQKDSLVLLYGANLGLPALPGELDPWSIISISGGQPIRVFGEWDGKVLTILRVF